MKELFGPKKKKRFNEAGPQGAGKPDDAVAAAPSDDALQ